MKHGGAIYIMTNINKTVLYTGVTSNLKNRVFEHKTKLYPNSFTAKYNLSILVYYEGFHRIEEAIAREKQIKAGSRKKKIQLIKEMNPNWIDLFDALDND